MNGRAFLFLLIAVAAGPSFVGCATQPMTSAAAEPVDVRTMIVGKPQIQLPGARLAEVRSIALGAAHSKGWTPVEETGDQLVLQRPMDPTSPQAVALGAAGERSPIVQVNTYLVEEPGGVRVALAAEVLTTAPDQTTKTVDYTEAYRADLERSLESLNETWVANRERVAAALTGTRSAAQSPEIPYPYGDPNADLDGVPSDPLKAAWASATTLVGEGSDGSATSGQATGASAPPAAGVSSPSAGPSSSQSSSSQPAQRSGGAPVVDMNAATAWGTGTTTTSTASEASSVAFNERPRTGMWAYYAEQFAITRGCALTDQGAVLVEQRPDAEILDVACANLPTFRLRCHNGVCRGLD
ncbi:hypothetical protein [Thiococcus pfennigii]|uniref:hypothetical protein n=1 Tax=Thiococcus pfennigii TaxID=1057 RepID=UPI001A93A887|nr:hypothetical protein [Thiococcus pfennigii]MBK1701351.1 hypothetical protein [Thiococcus pfennigii]